MKRVKKMGSHAMLTSRSWFIAFLAPLLVALSAGPSQAQTNPGGRNTQSAAASGEGAKVSRINNWTIAIAAGLLEGSFIRFAAELGKALDDGENLRILPIVTYGASENISDLLYLRGVDIAITHADVFDFYKKAGDVRNIEQRVNYISQMHNTEFYVMARGDITRIEDLAGKKVGFHVKGSGPSVTGPMIFERLGIKVEPVFINHTFAIDKMRTGEISAIFQLGAKPNDLLAKLKAEAGMHFVAINWGPKFSDYYLPATLSHDDYPNLIPPGATIDTLAVPVVLAVYNWPKNSDRYRRVERFVQYYFERFDKLKQPSFHPKWKEINLAARVPGWNRYPPAEEALAASKDGGAGRQANSNEPPAAGPARAEASALEKSPLFEEFLEWRQKRQQQQQQQKGRKN
jgi:TRAP-type uncharacterized transport system substrate-binding protein